MRPFPVVKDVSFLTKVEQTLKRNYFPVTMAMIKLKESGIPVRTDAMTVEEAVSEIMRVLY